MATRLKLDAELRQYFGINNVYFQPPPNIQMEYDCFRYELDDVYIRHADDMKYLKKKRYKVMLITKKWNEDLIDLILDHFDHITMGKPYRTENLYHVPFFIYY